MAVLETRLKRLPAAEVKSDSLAPVIVLDADDVVLAEIAAGLDLDQFELDHEIEARLASYGFDQNTIAAEVFVQAREVFLMFESLLNSTQQRRIFLLRELNNGRSFLKKSKNYRVDDVNCLPNHKAHERR